MILINSCCPLLRMLITLEIITHHKCEFKSLKLYYFKNYAQIVFKFCKISCFNYCSSRGYTYYGPMWGNQCSCGAQHPKDRYKKSESHCDKVCPGDGSAKCGGPGNSVNAYKIVSATTTTTTVVTTTSTTAVAATATTSYSSVANGDICERITTKGDCETAARELGLSDTTAVDSDNLSGNPENSPPNCYYKPGNPTNLKLIFNTDFTSNASCSNERNCLCISGKATYITGGCLVLVMPVCSIPVM